MDNKKDIIRDIAIETSRLILRKITKEDFEEIANILKDIEVMYAWEKSFSDDEVREWIDKNIKRYQNDGCSYLIAIRKDDNKVIGVMGPLIENIENNNYIGVAYILNKKYWGYGYATEGISACIEYAFNNLKTDKVIAQIRPENTSSIKVAERLNMKLVGQFVKIYEGKEMPHLIYEITR